MNLNKLFNALGAIIFCSLAATTGNAQTQYHRYVDPFIGSVGDGNVVVGPSRPFGMIKPGPDCNKYSNSGYKADLSFPVLGFSQVHVSGTGGGAKYGNISVMPFAGNFDSIQQKSLRQDEKTSVGYYSVLLKKWNIKTEITAAHKVAFYRFTFNENNPKGIKLDAGEFLNEGYNADSREAQFFVGSEIEVLSDREVCGYNRVRGGWNSGAAYTVYFHAIFDKPFQQFKTWKSGKLYSGKKGQIDTGEKTGALLSFGKQSGILQMKIGISFLSTAKAKQNVADEMAGWKFEEGVYQAQQSWEKLLSRIEIDKNTADSNKIMFYTGLYHTMLMPVDRTGENPLWKSAQPYYDDFYAIWDTYRSSHPLITLIDPKRQADIVNALLDIYRYDGFMPDARSGNFNGRTQGGSNADVVIADAYVKGLKGIDYELGLKAMLKNADTPPGGIEEKEGRGGLYDYNKLGYVSSGFVRAGTRTVEYAYNDFCIATVAKGLGHQQLFDRFAGQSGNWKNLWRNYNSHGANGFIMPRDATGKWIDSITCDVKNNVKVPFTPLDVQTGQCVCWWCGFLYEASSWEYSLSIPHDVAGLIKMSGGNNAFKTRLDTFFLNRYYNVGNEPSFLSPVLYHWIGRPDLSSGRVQAIIKKNFNASRKGIPGNDDSGAMSSWLAFHMMGFYPNAGQSYYLIHSPLLAETLLHLGNGKDFKITATNLSAQNKFIKSAKLNNQSFSRAWIEHSEIEAGGLLELEMTDQPSDWGRDILPPSLKF
ncbi:MAG: glycoside hydrolase family 92 protein [Ferruginibacter sp.]|nr:glycoside hydrolase family 92 protein [Ferruginibacter sp.]